MTTTNTTPQDAADHAWAGTPVESSTYYRCCDAIGRHATHCRRHPTAGNPAGTHPALAHIPPPAGARWVGPWQRFAGRILRHYRTHRWGTDIVVRVEGHQLHDGTTHRAITICDTDGQPITLDAYGARQVARDLHAAADMADTHNRQEANR